MGRAQTRPRNRQDRPPGRRRGVRELRGDHGSGHRGGDEEAQRGHRLPAAHLQLPGKIFRRRPDSGRLFQARGAADRTRDLDFAPDGPPGPSAVRRRLALRHSGDRHLHGARPGERPRYSRDGGGIGRPDAIRRAVHGSGRCRPGRLRQQRIRAQSADRRNGGERPRPRRRRHQRCRADGRVGGQGVARRGHARRRDVRPPAFPAGDRRHHPSGREGRQGPARAGAAR